MEMIIYVVIIFCSKTPVKFCKQKQLLKKFYHFYFVQNVYYPEKVYKSASKLLSLFETKYPIKVLLRMDLLYNKLYHSIKVKNTDLLKKFIVQKTYRDNYKSDHFLHQNTIKNLKS